MPIDRMKSIGRIYDAVADSDLVLVPDAPLADAINRRLDRPQLGTFATTPRRLATGRRETAEDRTAFLHVVRETELSWKPAARAVGDVVQCWEHEADPDAILDYDRFDTPAVRTALAEVRTLETTSRRLTEFRIDDDRDVAVVAPNQLTPLERSILPDAFDSVDPFTDGAFDRPPFRIHDSPAAIVDALLANVDEHNADDVAVVLDGGSEYSTLVESAFEAAGIPFYGGPGFADDPDHRAFCRLLRAAFVGSDLRIGDVRPLLRRGGTDPDVDHDEKRLAALDVPSVEWLREFCETIESRTFADALRVFEAAADLDLPTFREEVERLGLSDAFVTEERVDRLCFYLDSYEVPIDRENEGVLLADATAAAFVDRPVVFALGLDDGWRRSLPRRPWIDRDAAYERDRRSFQMLLQSGATRQYLVLDASGGAPVTPCLYFEDLLDADYERFSDLRSIDHGRPTGETGAGFERDPIDACESPEPIKAISQSSLSSYVNCPRDYLFGQLVGTPDRDYFEEGNLFHDFAELYVEHASLCGPDEIDDLAEAMLDEMEPFICDYDRPVQRTRFRTGLRTIADFLDEHPPKETDVASSDGWWGNFVADELGVDLESGVTERWFEDDDLGVRGLIDYVQSPTHLIDYKTGSKKRARRVVAGAALDPPDDRPNFQALLYLTYQRAQCPGEELSFTFVHFLESLDDVITGDADATSHDEITTTVRYYPTSFAEFVASETAYAELCDGYADCRGSFDPLGYDRYASILDDLGFPDADRDDVRESAYADRLVDRVSAAVPDDVDADVEKGCDQAIRALAALRARNFFREDLDAFETFLDERLDELNTRRRGDERFPIDGLAGEPNYRRVDHREMLLGGN